MEIAVFGGTFDPPTLAHQAIIAALCLDDRFDQVWVMPSGQRVDKPDMTADTTRLDLIEAALTGCPNACATDFEMHLPQPTQTIQTYQSLRDAYPDTRFRFVFGADSYHDMPNWDNGEYLQAHLPMVLIERVGYDLPEPSNLLWHLKVDRVVEMGMSSTLVRTMLAAGKSVDDMVCPEVQAAIDRHGLYSSCDA